MGIGGDHNLDIGIRVHTDQLTSGINQATSEIKSGISSMKTQFAGLQGSLQSLKSPFLAISAIVAGGALFGRMVSATHDVAEELDKTSQKTGISVEELSRLKYAAHQADLEFGDLTGSLQKLALNMSKAASGSGPASEGFKSLGIEVKGADGHLRPLQDVMGDVAERFHEHEEWTREGCTRDAALR
jgi:hypothetical protein